MSRTLLKRAVAAATALGLAGAATLALAPSAGAAEVGGLSGVGKSNPTVVNNSIQEAAGDVWVSSTNAISAGQTVTLQVAPPGVGLACPATASRTISFDSKPTVTGGAFTVALGKSNGCTVDNLVVLTATGAVAANTQIKLTKITYKIGDDVSRGAVRLGVGGAAPAAAFSNAKVARVDRLSGADRYATAAEIAGTCTSAADRESVVTIVSGENFPDALAASYLGATILLTRKGSLPESTAAALSAVGAEQVIVVGGANSVAPAVLTAISGISVGSCGDDAGAGKIKVVGRLAGQTRYDTARAIATSGLGGAVGTFSRAFSSNCDAVRTAIVVSGENYPDALAAGALASGGSKSGCGGGHLPLLLTQGTQLSPEVQEALLVGKIQQVIVVGGTNSVSGGVFDQIAEMDSIDFATRIAGKTRQDTAAELADMLITVGGYGDAVVLVSGLTFPDALVAGPAAGAFGWPILLARTATDIGPTAAAFITDTTAVDSVLLLGGNASMSAAVQNSAGDAFRARG